LRMGDGVVQIEEERPPVRALDERGRFLREEIVHVVVIDVRLDPLRVAIEVVGELPVRVAMIEEAERVVEALLVRLSCRTRPPESPLADDRGAIARIVQRHRAREVLFAKRNLTVAANPRVSRMEAGHQRRPRRRAHGAARVVLGEADPFARESIDPGRLDLRLPVRAQIAVAEIVGLDDEDVRLRRRRLRARQHGGERCGRTDHGNDRSVLDTSRGRAREARPTSGQRYWTATTAARKMRGMRTYASTFLTVASLGFAAVSLAAGQNPPAQSGTAPQAQ